MVAFLFTNGSVDFMGRTRAYLGCTDCTNWAAQLVEKKRKEAKNDPGTFPAVGSAAIGWACLADCFPPRGGWSCIGRQYCVQGRTPVQGQGRKTMMAIVSDCRNHWHFSPVASSSHEGLRQAGNCCCHCCYCYC